MKCLLPPAASVRSFGRQVLSTLSLSLQLAYSAVGRQVSGRGCGRMDGRTDGLAKRLIFPGKLPSDRPTTCLAVSQTLRQQKVKVGQTGGLRGYFE